MLMRRASPSALAAPISALALAVLFACEAAGDGVPEDASAAAAPASYTETIRGTEIAFDMVWVEPGGFWIGRTEVTWDEYLSYCDFDGALGLSPPVDAVARPSKPLDDVTPYDRYWGTGRRPAVGMSWQAARRYCEWLSANTGASYRLPTEAEWELACADSGAGGLDAAAWYEANSDEMTHEVGGKAANRFGLHDMLGNLWEYCAGPFDPSQPDRAVLRGGSWSDEAALVTPTARLAFEPDWVLDDPNVPPGVWWVPDGDHLGFRVLRSPPGAGR